MFIKQATNNKLYNNALECLLKTKIDEIEKLEKLIDSSLQEIETFQAKLKDLEEGLNYFLNQYYEYVFFSSKMVQLTGLTMLKS